MSNQHPVSSTADLEFHSARSSVGMAFLGLAMLAMLVALALPKDIAARSRNSRLCYKSSCNLADLWGCCTVGLAANPRN